MTTLTALLAQAEGANRDNAQIIAGIVSIGLGVLILIMPRLLNYIVAGYLILIGIIWLVAGL